MIISYEGAEFVKITHGDFTVALNPVSKASTFKSSSFGADLCLVSLNHPDMNGVETVSRGDKEPFIISGPGEYEIDGLFVEGFVSKSGYDGKERINTIYKMDIDGMTVVYLGAFGDDDLSNEAKEHIDDVDILFVPIGGEGVLDAQAAYKLAVKREPKVIIPIHFGSVGDKDALKTFLKEGGAEGVKAVDKVTLKPKDLVGLQGAIMVLAPSN
jgi:L-ascorbate metabolism protein UlaG (beta-lactamase superfamily)